MATCKYCRWTYETQIEMNDDKRKANDKGFCDWPCATAWQAEKDYALERERKRWKE